MPEALDPNASPDAITRAVAARLRAVLDSLPDAVYVYDAAWRWTYVNPAAQALLRRLGQDPEAVVGQVVWEALPRLRGSQFEREARRARATGAVVGYEEYIAAYDAWFEQRIVPASDDTVTVYSRDVSARWRAEAALRDSEARLRPVMDSGIVGLFYWHVDGRITEANDAFLAMLGYDRADLAVGRVNWRGMTPPEYAEVDAAAVRELHATGRHGQLAKEYVARDGRRVPVVVSSAMLEGSAEWGVCLCVDDTARRAAEERLSRVLMQTPAAVAVLLGPDHVVHSRNDMFLRLLGTRDYVGRPVREVAPELEAQGFLALLDQVYRTGAPYAGRETPLLWDRDGDGTRVEAFFDFVYQPLVDALGAVEGILVFAVEVTAQVLARRSTEALNARLRQQQAELEGANRRLQAQSAVLALQADELRSTASTLRGFLDSAPVLMGVVELVAEGGREDILHVYDNPVTDRFFGLAPGTSAGRRATELGAPPEVVAIWLRHYRRAEAEGGPVSFEYSLDGPDGPRWLAVTVGVAGTAPSGRMRFTYVAEDATARKVAEAERERLLGAERIARAEAERANRAKSEFLAVMSHELRTPLNAIGGYAELMEMGIRGPVTEQQREDLARIQRSQRHLLSLINEVLNYARLESGAVTYDVADVPVLEAVAAAEALVAPQLRAKGLDLVVHGGDPALAARADRDKLQQILLNLLANAIKFTNARPGLPGLVEVTCDAPDAATVRIAVRDTGIGIPLQKLTTIFEPFVQVDTALTRPHGGAGLGLAISRDLCTAMGGTLTVESTLGVGSTFTLLLPRAG